MKAKENDPMLSQEAIQLGTNRNVIRELFEFGKLRAAEIGAEECV